LRLTAQPAEHLVTARNTLTQILQGPRPMFTTRLDVSGMAEGQRAGLTLFGVRPSWIGVVRQGGRARVTLASEGAETPGPPVTGRTVELRAEVSEGQSVRYSYSLDGRRFAPFGDPIWLARFSWWKGSRPALFSFTRGASGVADFDWFHVTRREP